MPRLAPRTALLAALLLAGCQPKDPLDWKIGAGSPEAFDTWMDRRHRLLPPDLQQDFDRAFAVVRSDTATHLGTVDPARINAGLSRRLDGKTIRAVILDADDVESDALRTRISLTIDAIVRNARASESLENRPAEAQRFAEARAGQETAIKAMQARLDEVAAQVHRLSSPTR